MSDTVETSRLKLTPLSEESVQYFHAVWSDPEATQWSPHGPCKTIEDSREWMTGVLRSPEHDDRRSWAVNINEAIEPERTIGIISFLLTPHDYPERPRQWQLGYLFRPQYWGKGFATESCVAAMQSLKKGFVDRETVLCAAVDMGNKGSLRVLAKLGFRFSEHKVLGGPKRFLGGEWRPNEFLWFVKEL